MCHRCRGHALPKVTWDCVLWWPYSPNLHWYTSDQTKIMWLALVAGRGRLWVPVLRTVCVLE